MMLIGLTTCLTGCRLHTTERVDGSRVEHYLGYTTVTYPTIASSDDQLEVKEVENVGVGLSDGFILGYTNRKIVNMPPGNGLYLENLTDEQFDTFTSVLNQPEMKEVTWLLEKEPPPIE